LREIISLKIQEWGCAEFHASVSGPTAIRVDEHVIRDGGGTVEKSRAADGAVVVASFNPAISERIRDLVRRSAEMRALLFDPLQDPKTHHDADLTRCFGPVGDLLDQSYIPCSCS
jgi:hypothetical protein